MKNKQQSDDKTIMRAVFTLALAGAFTLPLQGCNDDVPVAEPYGEPAAAVRAPVEELDATTKASVIRGGRLYDNWFTEGGKTEFAVENPMAKFMNGFSATSPIAPYADFAALEKPDQYRCNTCHGYEYLGVEFYGGSIMNAADNKTLEEIRSYIKDGFSLSFAGDTATVHNFGASTIAIASRLTDADIADLANFIKYGVLNVEEYFYSFAAIGNGDAGLGKTLYDGKAAGCKGCHGVDGKLKDFDPTSATEYVGTIGQDNPTEMLHKIRFGHAGSEMPSIYESELTTESAVDIMTYTQQLSRQ